MNEHFQALPIGLREARAAYPLIYLHDASITLEEWLRFARRQCARPADRAGLMAIRDRRGIVHALFGYRVDMDLRANKRLCLSNLVIARVPGSMVDEAIAASADEIALRNHCRTISLDQPFTPRAFMQNTCPTAQELLAARALNIPSAVRH